MGQGDPLGRAYDLKDAGAVADPAYAPHRVLGGAADQLEQATGRRTTAGSPAAGPR